MKFESGGGICKARVTAAVVVRFYIPEGLSMLDGVDAFAIAKLTSCGKLQWYRRYDGGKDNGARELGRGLHVVPDGYVMSGVRHWPGDGYAFWLAKANKSGQLVWDRYVGGTHDGVVSGKPSDNYAHLNLGAAGPGGFFLAGWTQAPNPKSQKLQATPWLLRLTPTGHDSCGGVDLCAGKVVSEMCDDNKPCTIDSCLPDKGCVHTSRANFSWCGNHYLADADKVVPWSCSAGSCVPDWVGPLP